MNQEREDELKNVLKEGDNIVNDVSKTVNEQNTQPDNKESADLNNKMTVIHDLLHDGVFRYELLGHLGALHSEIKDLNNNLTKVLNKFEKELNLEDDD